MSKFLLLLMGAVLGVAGFLFAVHSFHNIHITAVFQELEPFPHRLPVYYKGFKLGHSARVYPSKDFTNTHVDILLNAKHLALPDNITAKVKTRNKKDYIELIYPDAPSITYLRNHSKIKGEKSFNISSYIDSKADSGDLDAIKENLNAAVSSAGETFNALTELITTGNEILTDIRPSIKESAENLVYTTRNFAEVSDELSRSVRPGRINNSFESLELSSKNLELATENISKITFHANEKTITLVDCVISSIYKTVNTLNSVFMNVNDIVKGFKTTLSKRFGGARLIFGKSLS